MRKCILNINFGNVSRQMSLSKIFIVALQSIGATKTYYKKWGTGIMRIQFQKMSLPVLLATLTLMSFAEEGQVPVLSAEFSQEMGQIVNGNDKGVDIGSYMIERTSGYLTLSSNPTEAMELLFSLGGFLWNPYKPLDQGGADVGRFFFWARIGQAYGIYHFFQSETVASHLQLGFFTEKYNPEAKNLGEYLFRSGNYPNYIKTGGFSIVDNAKEELLGFKFGLRRGGWKSNVIFHQSRDIFPHLDWNLTLLSSYSREGLFEFEAGIQFSNILPANPSRTTPKKLINAYLGDEAVPDSIIGQQDVDPNFVPPPGLKYYTFKGTKLMARASLDLKALLPMGRLAERDLIIYGETAVLGWKNYPTFYEKRSERNPIMIGLNMPTFGVFDLLSVEVERWTTPEKQDMSPYVLDWVPQPAQYDASFDAPDPKGDDIRWTVYLRKDLNDWVSLAAQASKDHLRPLETPEERPVSWEALIKNSHWYYMFRITARI